MAEGPFAVDEDNVLGALCLVWGDEYNIYIVERQWQAWRKDADIKDILTGETPDELNRAIRLDWLTRQDDVRHGPEGMGPS